MTKEQEVRLEEIRSYEYSHYQPVTNPIRAPRSIPFLISVIDGLKKEEAVILSRGMELANRPPMTDSERIKEYKKIVDVLIDIRKELKDEISGLLELKKYYEELTDDYENGSDEHRAKIKKLEAERDILKEDRNLFKGRFEGAKIIIKDLESKIKEEGANAVNSETSS